MKKKKLFEISIVFSVIAFLFLMATVAVNINPKLHTVLGIASKVSESNYNQVFNMVNEISKSLNIPAPNCYISDDAIASSSFNAAAKYIIINKKDYNSLSTEELKAVIAHELAHIKNNEEVYQLFLLLRQVVLVIIAALAFFCLFSFISPISPKLCAKMLLIFLMTCFVLIFAVIYIGGVSEIKADIEALKQTDLTTMKSMLFHVHNGGIFASQCGLKESDFNQVSDTSWKNGQGLLCKMGHVFDPHPYPTHRFFILKRADKLIKEGKEPVIIRGRPSNENEISVNY